MTERLVLSATAGNFSAVEAGGRAEKRLRMRETLAPKLFVVIFCSVRSTFCLSGLSQEMDLRTQWIHCHRQVYVQ